MSHHAQAVKTAIPHRRSLPTSYKVGAVTIPIPQNPSTPVPKSKSPGCAPYQRLYTGPPVDPVEEDHGALITYSRPPNGTPSSSLKKKAKPINHPPSSPSKQISVTSTSLSPLPQGPHSHDPAESFAAARLESLIPLPFIASASDDRRNVILPPSVPRPAPTRYTILFDAAHDIIMCQSLVNGTAQSGRQKKQLEELTRISSWQAKFIVHLEKENAMLRGLTAKGEPTKKNKKRKRGEKERERAEQVAYMDGLGSKIEGTEQEEQRKEREVKMKKVRKQRESLMEEPGEVE